VVTQIFLPGADYWLLNLNQTQTQPQNQTQSEDDKQIVLMGASMGGVCALYTAHHFNQNQKTQQTANSIKNYNTNNDNDDEQANNLKFCLFVYAHTKYILDIRQKCCLFRLCACVKENKRAELLV
jgi:hypothetical protein